MHGCMWCSGLFIDAVADPEEEAAGAQTSPLTPPPPAQVPKTIIFEPKYTAEWVIWGFRFPLLSIPGYAAGMYATRRVPIPFYDLLFSVLFLVFTFCITHSTEQRLHIFIFSYRVVFEGRVSMKTFPHCALNRVYLSQQCLLIQKLSCLSLFLPSITANFR